MGARFENLQSLGLVIKRRRCLFNRLLIVPAAIFFHRAAEFENESVCVGWFVGGDFRDDFVRISLGLAGMPARPGRPFPRTQFFGRCTANPEKVLQTKDAVHSLKINRHARLSGRHSRPARAVWFTPTKIGRYQINCAQLCRNGHSASPAVFLPSKPGGL